MKTEPMTSPAIVQAVYDYQKQRAELVEVLVRAASNPLWSGHNERVSVANNAIAVIDAKIERLCLRLTSSP